MSDSHTLESKLKAWIDNYYSEIAERPQMFAATPQALENIVWILEAMRHDLLAGAPASVGNPYQEFLTNKGFESASFTGRGARVEDGNKTPTSITFEDFVHFLHAYLESRGRLPHQLQKETKKRHARNDSDHNN